MRTLLIVLIFFSGLIQAQDDLLRKAEKGDAEAMFYLASAYFMGDKGYPKDGEKAVKWFQKSADKGYAESQNTLGTIYIKGWAGVKQDYGKAVKLLEKAVKSNHSDACNNLGLLYRDGTGVKQDYKKAVQLFQKGVDLGSYTAMDNLAYMYYMGWGVEKDYEKNLELIEKSVKITKDKQRLIQVAYFYLKGEEVKQNIKKAIELYTWGHENFPDEVVFPSYLGMIYMYYNDHGENKEDLAKALKWYKTAANLGDVNAMNNAAYIYLQNNPQVKNTQKGMEWLEKAANLGNPQAIFNLGYFYTLGEDNVPKDYDKAIEWFRKGEAIDEEMCISSIGAMYHAGIKFKKDLQKAKEYYLKATKDENLAKVLFERNEKLIKENPTKVYVWRAE